MQLVLLFLGLVLAFSDARTILWTNAGGNPLWNNAGNWDCQCLPTINDDVIIDIQAIPGNVQIGGVIAPALANSLTIGGTSRFLQTLTITGPLNVGTGGSKLSGNGKILVASSPDQPFNNDGVFSVDGSGFVFSSGVLAGKGSFNFANTATLNLTGPAQKVVSTTLIANGKIITDTLTGTNILVNKGGSFIVGGTFTTSKSLTVQTQDSAHFSVKGNLVFTGATLELQGYGFDIATWSVTSGVITIDNSINSGSLNIQGGSLKLIGGPKDIRTFGTVTGTASIYDFGGVNSFNSVTASSFNVTGGNTTISTGNIQVLTVNGGSLYGGRISGSQAILSSGFVSGGITLAPSYVYLDGVVQITDDRTAVIATMGGSVLKSSLLTLTGGSSFQIAASASFTQNAALQIVTGAPTPKSPTVNINGVFHSGGLFTVSGVPINGTGSFILSSSASWSLTNVKFDAKSFNSAGSVSLSVGSFNVETISGTGSFSGNPNTFIATSFSGNSYTLNAGNVRVANATLTTLTLNNGNFGISGSGKIGTLNFVGGHLSGTSGSTQVPVSVGRLVVSGSATQTLSSVGITTTSLSLDCALQSNCQFFSSNAFVKTA